MLPEPGRKPGPPRPELGRWPSGRWRAGRERPRSTGRLIDKVTSRGPGPLPPATGIKPGRHRVWLRRARRGLGVVLVALAVGAVVDQRHVLGRSARLVAHPRWAWLVLAVGFEGLSMVVFARLQHWLLRAGGVRVGLLSMLEITLAGNAMGTSLPGGAAWSATWAFGQLRRRGVDRVLSGWVILVAGALASYALFVLLVLGAFAAGSKGPVADLRGLAAALAAIPLAGGAVAYALARSTRLRALATGLWARAEERHPWSARPADGAARLVRRVGTVRPSPAGWADAFGLALANWALDAACLVACIAALGAPVPWRGVVVSYALAQVAASLPVTPGGLGVVEASLTALLIAYGMGAEPALAATLLYRLVSFWGLVPIGWAVWGGLELAGRGGRRVRVHPWAVHLHGRAPVDPSLARDGPGRLLSPTPCECCDERGVCVAPWPAPPDRALAGPGTHAPRS